MILPSHKGKPLSQFEKKLKGSDPFNVLQDVIDHTNHQESLSTPMTTLQEDVVMRGHLFALCILFCTSAFAEQGMFSDLDQLLGKYVVLVFG